MSEVAINNQGLQLLAELERTGAITDTSLVLPPDLTYDQYDALACMFGQIHRQTAFLLGDLLNYGEKVYGHTYAQASASTGLAEQTLMNYASVCSRIPRSRRRKQLAFSVHAEVASLPPREQEVWLTKAVDEGWTRSILREELAPVRAAVALGVSESLNGPVPAERVVPAPEFIPPAGESHICQCLTCGRYHRSDRDVEE